MQRLFSLNIPRRVLILSITALFALAAISVGELINSGATAMGSGSSSGPVQPYTGGAPISKVFYPSDGSTVTVTSTGAVIKQSPGHTPYREGWINTANISGLNSAADLKGQLASGSKNPYSVNTSSNNQSSSQMNGSNATPQAPTVSSTSNATANANVTLAGSGTSTTSSQNSSGQTTSSSNTSAPTSATSPTKSQSSSSANATLPNTGPGNALAVGGIATLLGTVSHFFYRRLRYRSLA